MTTMSSSRDAARSCVHFCRWNSDATFSFARMLLQVITSLKSDDVFEIATNAMKRESSLRSIESIFDDGRERHGGKHNEWSNLVNCLNRRFAVVQMMLNSEAHLPESTNLDPFVRLANAHRFEGITNSR